VHKIFGEELSKLAEPYATDANGFSETRWGNVFVGCIQPMLHNIRDVRRLISSIAVHIPLHVAGDVFEVNIIDFILLEALRVFEPRLHEALFREKELVLQIGRYPSDRMDDENKFAAERLLNLVSENRRNVTRDAIKELFPGLEWAYGGMRYANDSRQNWIEAKRVCTERYFPRYFELQTAMGEISERQFVAFLEATAGENELKAEIADIERRKLLPSLAARLDESVERLPVENATVLLPEMFTIAQKLSGSRMDDPFSSPWVSAWRATSWFLRRIPAEARGGIAVSALRQTEALSIAAMLIHLSDPADREEGQSGRFDPPLDLDTLETMKAEWLQAIRRLAIREGTLINDPNLMLLLYRWKDYAASSEEPREWVAKIIRTDEGFARITTRMMNRGTVHSMGDRVATPRHTFDKSTIEEFVGIELAKTRCDAIDAANFPEDREALRTLQYFLDVWLGLRERDPLDF
jgi:predicted KAP-like P-loop ATPase